MPYGDIEVKTDAGRALGIVVMFAGIGFVAMFTPAVAERFVRRDVEATTNSVSLEDVASKLDEIASRLDRLDRQTRMSRLPWNFVTAIL